MKYIVEDTPCRPRRYKVKGLPPIRDDNSVSNYFVSFEEAQKESDRRNK